MSKDYDAAIAALNTLQPNFAAVDAFKKSGPDLNKISLLETTRYLERIGYKLRDQVEDLNRLNPIHIAGTKGKGSTAAFVSSILCQYESSTVPNAPKRVGLYTSPHLMSVRERIRINNEPISEAKFAKYFFDVWNRLESYAEQHGSLELEFMQPGGEVKPMYFKFLTLLAFHVYLEEHVDTAIFECGIGGEYDATNVLDAPTVCAITALGIDHVAMLGSTIESIAWHKAGIFKPNARCKLGLTTTSQPKAAITVLKERAREREMELSCVKTHPDIENGTIKLGLGADFQKLNASLAIAVAAAHLKVLGLEHIPCDPCMPLGPTKLPAQFIEGLQSVQWPGRCEKRYEQGIVWHIDGGHTLESIELAAQWFASCLSQSRRQRRILYFNQQTRDAVELARTLHATVRASISPLITEMATTELRQSNKGSLFDVAAFSTNVTFAAPQDGSQAKAHYKADHISMNASGTDVSALTVQNELAQVWKELDQGCHVEVRETIQEAVETVREIARHNSDGDDIMIFATGSLHLVGGLLEILESGGVVAGRGSSLVST